MFRNFAVQIHAVWTVNAVLLANMKYVHVCQVSLALRQVVGPSVLLARNVHKIEHVSIKSASIRAFPHADNMHDAKSLITIQSVHVHLVIRVILLFAV